MVRDLPALKRLKDLTGEGYNIQIVGYDAIDDITADNVEAKYLDDTKAFGHESVLFIILTVEPDKYPWVIHKTEEF